MHTTLNAKQLGNAVPRNLNCNVADVNRYLETRERSVVLARAIKAMADRGEIEIAAQMVAEFRKARQDADNLQRVAGIVEEAE